MLKLVPFTKILATALVSLCAIALHTTMQLLGLLGLEVIALIATGLFFKQFKVVMALSFFAIFLGVVQVLGGGTLESAYVAALRMACMSLVFIFLLATTSLQDLTAALVTQCKVPYEYAFMFTAALRFIPDFIKESHMVQEAQVCRGMSTKGNIFKRMASYASVIQPLVLKSLGRSETLALALELKGFGGKNHSFAATVGLKAVDYIVIAMMIIATVGVVVFK